MDIGRTARFNPPLHSQRLHLEPQCERHAEAMFAAIGEPALYTFIDHGPPASAARLHQVYRQLQDRASSDGSELWLNWVLFARELAPTPAPGPGPLGFVQASVLPDGRAWVAYVLAHAAWGQGYAAEALATMLQHLFDGLGVRQAMASVEMANTRSILLLQRCGFTRASGAALHGHTLTASEQLWLRAAA